MNAVAIVGEKWIGEFISRKIRFEVMQCPKTVWCGALAYAKERQEEPEIPALLERYQKICGISKKEPANPEWSCAISIDYWQQGAVPRGMMFAQQVLAEEQDSEYDVYTMPESLFVRLANSAETAKEAFGKESCEVYELFGIIKDSLKENGYAFAENGAQEIELYCYAAGKAYAYVPVVCIG